MAAPAGTGIPQLDVLLAPVPEHACVVFANDPGVEAEPFLYQMAHRHLEAGRTVVYLVASRAPSSVVEGMRDYGFDPTPHGTRLVFIDAFSAILGSAEDATFTVDKPADHGQIVGALRDAVSRFKGATLILDGLSTLIDGFSEDGFAKGFKEFHKAVKSYGASALLLTKWPYSDRTVKLLDHFDAIVSVRGVQDRITYGQYFAVERANWVKAPDAKPRLFKMLKPGGVFVYIPKIVVTGPHNAGKSNFIHSVADSAVSVDRLGTTIAMDHGRVMVHGMAADLFGTPGQERFDTALRTIAGQALGVIILVDSTKPDTFPRAREMMDKTWKDGLPAIIVANKQDLPGAMSPEDVAKLIQPPSRVRVVGCVGSNRASSRQVLEQLLDQITAGRGAA